MKWEFNNTKFNLYANIKKKQSYKVLHKLGNKKQITLKR